MKQLATTILILPALLGISISAFAQEQDYRQMREELIDRQETTRAEIEELNGQIGQYEERLELAEEKYDRLYNQYEDLKRVIALQDEKLDKMEEEQDHVIEEIRVIEQEINRNEQELNRLIEEYKETLSYIYKHGRSSELALILASESINQMLVRAFYLRKFDQHRTRQAEQIEETQDQLADNKDNLEESRERNNALLEEIRAETEELDERRAQQERNVALMRRDRKQMQERLEQAQQERDRLNETLDELIAEEEEVRQAMENRIREMEEERKRRLAEARTIDDEAEREREVERFSNPVEREGFLDDEALASIEESFISQKGELAWPVESNTIGEEFGQRRHPVYGTTTENIGVEIVTKSGEDVRVIHDGYVFAIRPMAGFGDVVFVSHGKYKTAYGNLSEINVSQNSVLEAGDVIGQSGDESSTLGESLFFMVSEGSTPDDPMNWLVEK